MAMIGVRELKIRVTEVMREVQMQGARYIITYRGKPVAQLAPLEEGLRGEPCLNEQKMAARAVAEIRALRQKLANWPADLTQSVVAAHWEEEGEVGDLGRRL